MSFATSSSGVAKAVARRATTFPFLGGSQSWNSAPPARSRAAFVHRHGGEHHVGLDRSRDLDIRKSASGRRQGAPPARWPAPRWRSQRSPSSIASSWAETNRILDARCPPRLRRYSKSRRNGASKNTTASAARAPALVAPKDKTSTPHFQVASAGVQPRFAMALAKRAPSMCSFMPRAWTSSPIAASSRTWNRPCPVRSPG